jgi:hypothetical protein
VGIKFIESLGNEETDPFLKVPAAIDNLLDHSRIIVEDLVLIFGEVEHHIPNLLHDVPSPDSIESQETVIVDEEIRDLFDHNPQCIPLLGRFAIRVYQMSFLASLTPFLTKL